MSVYYRGSKKCLLKRNVELSGAFFQSIQSKSLLMSSLNKPTQPESRRSTIQTVKSRFTAEWMVFVCTGWVQKHLTLQGLYVLKVITNLCSK